MFDNFISTTTTTYGAVVYNTNLTYTGTYLNTAIQPAGTYPYPPDVNLAKLTQQIDELKDFRGIQKIEIHGSRVSVTYDEYTVCTYDRSSKSLGGWKPVTYKDFTLTIDFSHHVRDHDKGFVEPSCPNLPERDRFIYGWAGRYSDRLGNGTTTARHLEKMRTDGELISILQALRNLFNTNPLTTPFNL